MGFAKKPLTILFSSFFKGTSNGGKNTACKPFFWKIKLWFGVGQPNWG